MSFCIPYSAYLANIGLYDLVSGPSESCTDCSPSPSFFSAGSNFFMASVSDEVLFFVSESDSVSNFIAAGEGYMLVDAVPGAKDYNSQFGFHLDVSTADFSEYALAAYDVPFTQIQSNLLASGQSSARVCLRVADMSPVEHVGKFYCDGDLGLAWQSTNYFDPQLGRYVQVGSCSGSCPPGYDLVSNSLSDICVKQLVSVTDDNNPVLNGINGRVNAVVDQFRAEIQSSLEDPATAYSWSEYLADQEFFDEIALLTEEAMNP
jgi:hypothetical protein